MIVGISYLFIIMSRDATGRYARWEARARRCAVRPLDLLTSCKFSETERLLTMQLLNSRHRQRETTRSLFDVPASHAPRHNPSHRLHFAVGRHQRRQAQHVYTRRATSNDPLPDTNTLRRTLSPSASKPDTA